LISGWWKRIPWLATQLTLGFLIALAPALSNATGDVALVVGSETYDGNQISGAVDDARSLTAALEERNVDVTFGANLSLREWETMVSGFSDAARGANLAVIAYAGHALKLGENAFVVPVNVTLRTRSDLNRLVPLQTLLDAVDEAAHGLVLLDTCRESTLAAGWGKRGYGKTPVCADAEIERLTAPGTAIIFGGSEPVVVDETNVDDNRLLAMFGRRIASGDEPGAALTRVVRPLARRDNVAHTQMLIGSFSDDLRFAIATQENEASTSNTESAVTADAEFKSLQLGVRPGADNALTTGENDRSTLKARLSVNTWPADARVRILNILPAYEFGMSLWANEFYQVEATHPDYAEIEGWVRLGKEDLELTIRLDTRVASKSDGSGAFVDPPDSTALSAALGYTSNSPVPDGISSIEDLATEITFTDVPIEEMETGSGRRTLWYVVGGVLAAGMIASIADGGGR